jgi:alpha-ketoglutarate-dependent taurine dioxygenase
MTIRQSVPPILTEETDGARAWQRDTVSAADWLVAFPDACLMELEDVVERLRGAPAGPIELLTPDRFPLAACARLMTEVRVKLVDGPGLAVVDRVPVERYSQTESKALGWLLASLLGRIVAQKRDGTRLYDVKDYGKPLGYGVRRSVTNLEQPFHTDGPWLWKPAAFVGLYCLQSAVEGGLSRVVSLVTAHNEMRQRHSRLLARLYRPFHWDRQAEHDANEPRWATHPVFAADGGTLTARYYEDYIRNGQRLANEPLDAEGADALAAIRETVDDPMHWMEFRLERGQLQYLNNRQIAHSRTGFGDSPEPGLARHMLRLWNREEGTCDVEGQRPA